MTTPYHPSGDAHYTRRDPAKIRRGVDAPGAKLTPEDIAQIAAWHALGRRTGWIAKQLKVSRMTVWRQRKALSNVTES